MRTAIAITGYAHEQAALDRDDAMRAARAPLPSASIGPRRCANCSEWALYAVTCPHCGAAFTARALVGMARVLR